MIYLVNEKFYIQVNGFDNEDYGFEIIKRPKIDFPIRRYSETEIKGHDGMYYVDENTVDDITFTLECNFIEEQLNEYRDRLREVDRWLRYTLEENNKLILNNDDEYYYKVIKYNINSVDYEDGFYEINKFNIEFTVEGYKYKTSNKKIKVNNFYRNPCDLSKPKYFLIGNGKCSLNVNGNVVNCNVNGQLIIDTEHDKILNSDGSYAIGKTDIKHMQDLYLKHNKNNITISDKFELYMIPNLRVIS